MLLFLQNGHFVISGFCLQSSHRLTVQEQDLKTKVMLNVHTAHSINPSGASSATGAIATAGAGAGAGAGARGCNSAR
jgi:hypothetical protein